MITENNCNQNSSKWKKVNKIRHFTVIAVKSVSFGDIMFSLFDCLHILLNKLTCSI